MLFDALNGALQVMQKGPKPLERSLSLSAQANDYDPASCTVAALKDYLRSASAGDEIANVFRRALAAWDNESTAEWAADTERNSETRRARIYEALGLDDDFKALCDAKFPFQKLDAPVVIATEHTPWYTDQIRRSRSFYWNAYVGHLAAQGWPEDSVRQLDDSTARIVERLADPADEGAYQTKGLVVGYVQSGKTANFTGVIAKAADAGYKLIIILAGTLDVLRSQTQRRIDKEMIGQELLDRDYVTDDDWDLFLKHGARPSTLGAFDWYRLTGPESDYQKLGRGIEALQFERLDQQKPLWHPDNLFATRSRIAIVKKHSAVLNRLLADLRLLQRRGIGAPLDQIPTLIIDDESDQASINVRAASNDITPTNKAITDLLRLLPRSQYVGYTATPFANVFVDPANEEDIFPKDFMISLPRPALYMGVSDFYDLDGRDDDDASRPNEVDYVRAVTGDDSRPDNLLKAIDSFILSGAIKKFRAARDPKLKFRHHTMLAHSSTRTADHEQLADAIRTTFRGAAYDGSKGRTRLRKLFEEDFKPVNARRGDDLAFPESFEVLAPFVGECLTDVGDPADAVKILNFENKDDAPDFDKEATWKILVGGTKLSRGYTVEGLTVSYYRRRAQTADTLMQMGRWFGFRRGYHDLVRLFIGTDEPIDRAGRRRINLYRAFGAICRDEEMFREELKRYANMEERITPAQIPPLVPSHMLRPTANNKMFNARVTYSNFGGRLSESTFAPDKDADIKHNHKALLTLLDDRKIETVELAATVGGASIRLDARTVALPPEDMIAFLKDFHWFNTGDERGRPKPMQLQIEFLERTGAQSAGVTDWLLLAPQVDSDRTPLTIGKTPFNVIHRGYNDGRFGTYNDPKHRALAEYIAYRTDLPNANQGLQNLRSPGRGVIIYYPVTPEKVPAKAKAPYGTGFTLLFPPNNIATPITFGVRRQDKSAAVVVPV
ncbi:Z1 domain-containing protein [Sphingomonas sp.]|uniref:Z1 domain-containing protein n=1 Tax=Sphingomonas sp. TaxID=28214 RepID=UPI001B121794|nr:Z1 domain-containing protein [Sphingomonas sp.]MBO9712474.1 Z1 domain-containing protein [Sphingomonas sp.]